MPRFLPRALVALLLLAPPRIVAGQEPTRQAREDDPQLLRAARLAHRSFPEFLARLASPPADQSALAVKVRMAEPRGRGARRDSVVEQLWIHPLSYRAGRIHGFVANTPVALRRIAFEDTLTVSTAIVTDWYAVERDTMVAGFSIRVFHQRQSRAARAEEDRTRGFVILPEAVELRRRGLAAR